MKRYVSCFLVLVLLASLFSGCVEPPEEVYEGTEILLSDDGITVDGNAISTDEESAVYEANDIVYYEEGHDFTYGEGTEEDAHSAKEAAAHTVVHITKAGTYILSGKLSKGQIAIDLGKDAKSNPKAVVTLVLMSVDITCTVAPAIIFYNVYECGSDDPDDATAYVDTSNAGANIILPLQSTNTLRGSYVAKIYKPDSVELNADGTEVADAKKLHKYDGALYSKMSMNIWSGKAGGGRLNILAENEGIGSELHLTVYGGDIDISSGNDGINTNEDGVSVTTIKGGCLNIRVNGATGEGDGIDSNGWLVINGGQVFSQACATSMDAGVDSDMGIHINGGTVFATGNMLDRIAESQQNYAVLQMAQPSTGAYHLKRSDEVIVCQYDIANSFTYALISCPALTADQYTLWSGQVQMAGIASDGMGGQRPGGMMPPGGMEPPEGNRPPQGQPGQRPEGDGKPNDYGFVGIPGVLSTTFTIKDGENYFVAVQKAP
jgi:hypothetical protein